MVVALLVLASLGCSEPKATFEPDPAPGESVAGDTKPAFAGVPAKLPVLADALPGLDDDRLSVAGPKDWLRPPRDPKWLVWFKKDRSVSYPALLVLVEESPELAEVDQQSVYMLVSKISAELKAKAKPSEAPPEVRPVRVGDFVGVEYADEARTAASRVERLFLITVAAGRRYTLELRVASGTRDQYRPYALAVAGGMHFGPAAEEAPAAIAPPEKE